MFLKTKTGRQVKLLTAEENAGQGGSSFKRKSH